MTFILSVEDDPLSGEWIRQTIAAKFPDAQLKQMSTEYEFVSKFEEIASNPPDVVLMDVMLRWTDPAPDMPPRPDDVREGGIGEAGLRCQQRFQADLRTKAVPVILYTVLQKESLRLPANVVHVQKDADPTELIQTITLMLGREPADSAS